MGKQSRRRTKKEKQSTSARPDKPFSIKMAALTAYVSEKHPHLLALLLSGQPEDRIDFVMKFDEAEKALEVAERSPLWIASA